jgi:hypothetical protein
LELRDQFVCEALREVTCVHSTSFPSAP